MSYPITETEVTVIEKECLDCKLVLPISDYQIGSGKLGYKPQCKKCTKAREIARQEDDPLHAKLTIMADGILSRTKYVHCTPFNKSYKERGIKCLIGENKAEVRSMLNKHFRHDVIRLLRRDENPSVDRIDPYRHYELGNIQIIPLRENRRRADMSYRFKPVKVTDVDGNITMYESIKGATKALGYPYASVVRWGYSNKPNKQGYLIEILGGGR